MKTSSRTSAPKIARSKTMAALAGLALVLSACSAASETEVAQDLPTLEVASDKDTNQDDSDGATEKSGPDEEVDPEKAQAEYEACMSEQGVDLGIFEGASSGEGSSVQEFQIDSDSEDAFDFEAFEAAQEECESILTDAFGDFEATPEQEAEFNDQMLEMSKCMNEAGFDIDLSGGSFELDEDVDFEEFNAAMDECQPDFSAIEIAPSS